MKQSFFLRAISANQATAEPQQWAKDWLTKEASPAQQRLLGPAYVQNLAKTDPAAALTFAQSHLAATGLTEAVGNVIATVRAKDAAGVKQLAEQLPPGGVKNRAAFEAIGPSFSRENAQWLQTQAEPTAAGWSQYAKDWATKDPATFRAYLESSPDEPFPLPLLRSGLQQLLETDAPAAMKLATLQGPDVLQTTLDTWLKHDPKAAKAWLANPQNQKENKK